MNTNNCTHTRAIPAPDFASAGGYYCPDCRRGCARPSVFAPPPGRSVVSTETPNPPLLTTPVIDPPRSHPKEAPLSRENSELSERLHSKQLVSSSKHKQAHDVYEVSTQGRKYYRYIVTRGHEVDLSIHIRGGNITNSIAIGRADQVRRWIRQGLPPDKIAPMIRQWR